MRYTTVWQAVATRYAATAWELPAL